MKIRYLLQVAFLLSWLTLSKSQDVIGPGPSCVRMIPADGQTRVMFMNKDAVGVRSLYLTLWSQDMRLLVCEVNPSPLVTEGYQDICNQSDTRGEEIIQRFNISKLLDKNAPCARVSSSAPKFAERTGGDWTEKKKSRRKRAWIFPGTLWCGSGSRAVGYEQLGMFESADRCCREHDHCLHIIPAFTVNYGVFNPNFYTVSHCECDQRFRQCLLNANDSISSMVGYSFFNILRVPCFELKQQKRCTEMYWWGMCKVAKKAPYAVFKKPLPYTNTSTGQYPDTDNHKLQVTIHEMQNVTKSPVIQLHRQTTKSKHRCLFREPPRGDTFHRRRTKGRGCKRHPTPSQMPPQSRSDLTTPSMRMGPLDVSKSHTVSPNKTRAGKRRGHSPQQVENSRLQMPSPPPLLTQRSKLQVHPTIAVKAEAKSRKTKTKQKNHCCGSRMPVRGDTFQPHCKSCPEKATPAHMTMTNRLPITRSPDTLWNATINITFTPKEKITASPPKDDKPQQEVDHQEPMSQRNQRQNSALHKMTGSQYQCGSLKHLDECKFKIPPMEKKYNLQNTESKTVYHCDCTQRLALQIESFKQPWILVSLLVDFVSQRCFVLPKEKKCNRKESCSGRFTETSDLHQALKKIEEKDITRVRISGSTRKRGIPVRLHKRCLRLQKARKGS